MFECPGYDDISISEAREDATMEESAAVFVSAVVLTIVTIIAMSQIFRFFTSGIYPSAQRALCVLFFLPVAIGWISLEHVYTKEKNVIAEKFLNLYKAMALFSFMYYMNRMLGWTVADGKSFYTEEASANILMKQGKADCYLKCIPTSPLTTPEECRWFVKKTNFGVLQMALMLVFLELLGVVLIFYDYCLFKYVKEGLLYEIVLIGGIVMKFTSSGIALNFILNYSLFCAKIPEFRDLAIMSKFVILKLAMFLTEIQTLIIYGFALIYVKVYDTEQSALTVTLYTNSLLLCSEMIICGILQFTIFPISDFHFHPILKEKLIKHDAKHAHDEHTKEA